MSRTKNALYIRLCSSPVITTIRMVRLCLQPLGPCSGCKAMQYVMDGSSSVFAMGRVIEQYSGDSEGRLSWFSNL